MLFLNRTAQNRSLTSSNSRNIPETIALTTALVIIVIIITNNSRFDALERMISRASSYTDCPRSTRQKSTEAASPNTQTKANSPSVFKVCQEGKVQIGSSEEEGEEGKEATWWYW